MAFGLTEAILCVATFARSFKLRPKAGHKAEVACRLTLRPGDRAADAAHESFVKNSRYVTQPRRPPVRRTAANRSMNEPDSNL
jgi:hypothetical protein